MYYSFVLDFDYFYMNQSPNCSQNFILYFYVFPFFLFFLSLLILIKIRHPIFSFNMSILTILSPRMNNSNINDINTVHRHNIHQSFAIFLLFKSSILIMLFSFFDQSKSHQHARTTCDKR